MLMYKSKILPFTLTSLFLNNNKLLLYIQYHTIQTLAFLSFNSKNKKN